MQFKHILLATIFSLLLCLPSQVVAQSTEGTDFWVTLMRSADNDPTTLSLTISAQAAANVTIENPTTGFSTNVTVAANGIRTVEVNKADCYVGDAENKQVTAKALHVTSDTPISLIAANYRDKSFDVAAILPTDALLDDYVVCTYPATVHSDAEQGTHFAIVATEDNTIVDYALLATPDTIRKLQNLQSLGFELTAEELAYLAAYEANPISQESTPVMMRGQVFYYWTGPISGDASDLTGTTITARDGKKIAVFNGDSHTNIPNKTRDRDHIYSQAMPTAYWGTQFALTSSLTTSDGATGLVERIDKVRVQALEDGTVVVVNGDTVHVFDFAVDKKHFYEFEFGANTVAASPYPAGTLRLNTTNCYVQTSCPCGVHLYMVSNQYDYPKDNSITGSKYCNGDPAMIWISPIEQQIEEITFGTFQTLQVQDHFLNIVTAASNQNITLDGNDISSRFSPMVGNSRYKFARMSITNGTHTLYADGGAIAHVYGFGEKESYGYPAGAKTVPLEQFIIINGEKFSAETQNTLCGTDTIHFSCDLNYAIRNITWNFGDGSPTASGDTAVDHYYPQTGVFAAYVIIDRESANLCQGQLAHDSIPFSVTIGRYEFAVTGLDVPCQEEGQAFVGKVFYSNPSSVDLHGDNVTLEFDDVALAAGFKNEELVVEPNYFQITIPATAQSNSIYGLHLAIASECGAVDTVLTFMLNYDKDVIAQRYDNVLGLLAEPFEGKTLDDFQWYRVSDSTAVEGQVSANLNFYDIPYGGSLDEKYYVCFTVNKGKSDETMTCACAKSFVENASKPNFAEATLSAYITAAGRMVFVNADFGGETDIVCTAQWITVDGHVYNEQSFSIPDGGCTIPTPEEAGLYLLRVTTDKAARSFKFIINK